MRYCFRRITVVLLVFVFAKTMGQQAYYHPAVLGADFSVYGIRNGSYNAVSVPGIGLQYISAINGFSDWTIKVNGGFANQISKPSLSEKKFFFKTDLLFRRRLYGGEKFFQLFVQTGVEAVNHNRRSAPLIPVDAGVELNFKNIYFLFNLGYHKSFSRELNSFFQYGIGISGVIGIRKKKALVIKTVLDKTVPPDTDGDGIIDAEDSCRTIPGSLAFHGCPDSDGDGIQDKADRCPLVFGVAKYQGCPIPDTDQDGINDEEDSCIDRPGMAQYHGCPVPDTDGDGLNDEEDSCIHIAGTRSNHGCPSIRKEIREEIKSVAKNILFKTGSYELARGTSKVLDKVASVLAANPDLKLLIEGHTDNQGGDQLNQLLSENRASTVMSYLEKKGIRAERLRAIGYGQAKPVDTNETAEGRLRNRRVELILSY